MLIFRKDYLRPVSGQLKLSTREQAQTFLDAWMLSHAVDKEKLKLVVIGLNYFRFNVTKAEVRLDLGNRRFPFNDVGQLNEILDIPLNSFSSLNQLAWLINNKRHLHLKRAKIYPRTRQFHGPPELLCSATDERRRESRGGQTVHRSANQTDRNEDFRCNTPLVEAGQVPTNSRRTRFIRAASH